VPPGDTAVIPFVSIDRGEASARLHTIKEILNVLGVAFDARGEEIAMSGDRRVLFRVATCSVSGTVGFTSVACFADEMARWESRDTAANPAREVMGSLRPTMATQPHAFEVCSSSPWSEEDYHHELFTAGDGEHQVTAHAATWEANPTLSEETTRALEPDQRVWLREYAAIPGGTVTESWFGSAVDAAIEKEPPPPLARGIRVLYAIDPAFDGESSPDRFGWACLTSEARNDNGRITRVRGIGAWKPDRTPFEMARRVRSEVCDTFEPDQKGRELAHVYSDQYEGHSWTELARQAGLIVEVVPWTGAANDNGRTARFKSVRTAMLNGDLTIPNDPDLIRELRSVRGVLAPSGVERIELPRTASGHCDRVASLVLGASIALSWSPSTAEPAKPVLTREDRWRLAAIREIGEKRRREWQRSPVAAMRKAVNGR